VTAKIPASLERLIPGELHSRAADVGNADPSLEWFLAEARHVLGLIADGDLVGVDMPNLGRELVRFIRKAEALGVRS